MQATRARSSHQQLFARTTGAGSAVAERCKQAGHSFCRHSSLEITIIWTLSMHPSSLLHSSTCTWRLVQTFEHVAGTHLVDVLHHLPAGSAHSQSGHIGSGC